MPPSLDIEKSDRQRLLSQEPDQAGLREAYELLSSDILLARSKLELLANAGSVLSMMYLANSFKKEYLENKSGAALSTAERWYRKAFENGALNAYAGLGATLIWKKMYKEAEEVFVAGTKRDDSVSMYYLAKLILRDYSDRSPDKRRVPYAIELLDRAAELGQVRAKNRLAFFFLAGKGGAGKLPKGLALYFSSLLDGFRVGIRNPDDRRLW
jgi:TPR repeat protein